MGITLKFNLSTSSIRPSTSTAHISRSVNKDGSSDIETDVIQVAPTTPRLINPSAPSTPSTSTSTPTTKRKGTPASAKSKSKAKPKPKSKVKPRPSASTPRPSAIPHRLLSAGPSTPRAGPSSYIPEDAPLPELGSPVSSRGSPSKSETIEEDADPLSLPLSPAVEEVFTPKQEEGVEDVNPSQWNEVGTPLGTPDVKEKQEAKWKRLKKPLKELMNKVMVELRRRDEYALFEEPVNTDDFPDYLAVVGGEENTMDLGTMQSKVDNRGYRNIDEMEADLRTLVTAAQTFNLPGTIPHSSAGRVLQYGLKHIERNRPLVRTPSPSPVRDTATPAPRRSAYSTREGTAPPNAVTLDLPPHQIIPVEMLNYPPGSLVGHAVGWNVNGGRHIWTKKQIRGRERFSGKWRHSGLDGTKELKELEDADDWLASAKTARGAYSSQKVDWRSIHRQSHWWEVDLGGPTGVAPLPFTPYPKPVAVPTQNYAAPYHWGTMPRVDESTAARVQKTKQSPEAVLSNMTRPTYGPPVTIGNEKGLAENVFAGHLDVQPEVMMGTIMYGDATGEAYQQSLRNFVKGAMDMAEKDNAGDVKMEQREDRVGLDEWVEQNWRGGIGSSRYRSVYHQTCKEVQELARQGSTKLPPSPQSRLGRIRMVAEAEYQRRALQWLTAQHRALDISSLLTVPADFTYVGIGGRFDVLTGMTLCGQEIVRLSKDVNAKKRKRSDEDVGVEEKQRYGVKLEPTSSSLPPRNGNSEVKVETPEERSESLRKLRLELSAMSKFYPLSALKKLSKEDAEKYLPVNVRPLLTVKAEEDVKA